MHFKILFVFICITIFSHSQAVRIGKYVVSTEDLNVTRFNNGDEIPLFKSEEEAIKYSKEGKPACIKVGNSIWYNWYAANDKRGIAPSGWYLPEWRQFDAYGETVRIHYIKSGFRKNKFPGMPTSKYNGIDIYNWWVGGEMKEFTWY